MWRQIKTKRWLFMSAFMFECMFACMFACMLGAMRVHAQDLEPLEQKARAELETGNAQKAILMYRRLAQLDQDNPERFITLGNLYAQYGQWPELKDAATALLHLEPLHQQGLKLAVTACVQQQDWSGSRPHLDKLIQHYPTDPWGFQQYAITLAALGLQTEADAMRERYLGLSTQDK